MNINDMISKMNPELLSKNLKKISPMIGEEQAKKMEQAIKNMGKNELLDGIKSLSGDDFKRELENNPALLKSLSKNPELIKKLSAIFNEKK